MPHGRVEFKNNIFRKYSSETRKAEPNDPVLSTSEIVIVLLLKELLRSISHHPN